MNWQQMGIYVLFFIGLYYVLILWPRRSQDKRHRQMLDDLSIGIRVITIGGIYGRIAAIKGDSFMLEVSDGVLIEVSDRAISHRVTEEEPEAFRPKRIEEETAEEE